jgi:tRNA nucleotidyltransferase (CCA-adding enzyme)
VDRAVSHKLNLSAASLMEAGEVVVKPGDSIEQLQRIMTETGWGQVPVVHPETGQIIGIVTRTDLLKTLAPEAKWSGHPNLAKRLEAVLPAERLALLRAIAEAAHEMHIALYIVGGFVRDLLLERPSFDFDLVVEGDAIALAYALAQRHGGRVTSHARFGTAKWYLALKDGLPSFIDLITARTEFYTHPTALPTIERGSIKLDLHRRDFTINTLALRLDGHHYGELHDYWGGLNDLRQGLVRCLHSLSFVDDPTRMLRAVRFEQRFEFVIEERTLQLLREALTLLDRVSGDRIRHELDHIIDEERAARMLARLDRLGLLKAIHPDLQWDDWLYARIEALARGKAGLDWEIWEKGGREDGVEARAASSGAGGGAPTGPDLDRGQWNGMPIKRVLAYILLLVRLPASCARRVLARLKASRSLTEEVLAACALWADLEALAGQPPSQVVARMDEVTPLSLAGVFFAASNQAHKEMLYQYATRWRNVAPSITGHDLRARGLTPGPQYARILGSLRAAWLDEEIQSISEEKELLEKLIRET